ncbi:MAG TPA: type I methionyl aminopeptidase [Bacteroidales bacterium]|nr:MAG: type I methionyl aminopeptidase [Bacteroidetes bacterium GWE2_42_24]OFY29282.1 MAG: type I methionyl aminopeptidase [Bacteroidetes bacterium GWF2_43_11]PKP16007.1 MAG: type I methionyl aminopeptidase [Bacteroidetes bacterium HGW-Bacteroidetes-22]HBZ66726.1 type I methionyl aminopeptidase [Bacteroidales bacterium]
MIHLKSEEEIELIRQSSLLVGKTLAEVARIIDPGITTEALDRRAEEFIRDNGGKPGFKGYNGFPSTLCISINEVVVHGFPSKREVKEGDIVSVDCGVLMNGFHGDSAFTFVIGEVDASVQALVNATRESLTMGIEQAVAGNRIGDIGYAIQQYVEMRGYSVVRDLVGHGLGRNLHESPDVPNYGRRGVGHRLQSGLVLAIEPMINLGGKAVVQERDGWTIRTTDRKASAHFEHDVVVRQGKAEVLSTFEFIDEVLKSRN